MRIGKKRKQIANNLTEKSSNECRTRYNEQESYILETSLGYFFVLFYDTFFLTLRNLAIEIHCTYGSMQNLTKTALKTNGLLLFPTVGTGAYLYSKFFPALLFETKRLVIVFYENISIQIEIYVPSRLDAGLRFITSLEQKSGT